MKKPTLTELQSILERAKVEKLEDAAPTLCVELGFYRLGFNANGTVVLWEWVSDRTDGSKRYEFGVEASTYQQAYIKVLELLIDRHNESI